MPVNQVQLRSFVLDGLRAIGADPKEISREIYQATLPTAEVQRIFANQKEITFTFQRAMLEDYPKAELVTIGGHLLNRLIDVLRKRAQAATVMLISREPTPPAQFACPLPTRNSKAVGATVIPGYTPFTQFLLKTTYLTDEKFEQIFEVSVDHATGKLEIGGDTFSKLLPKAVKPGRPAEHIFAQLDETQALRLAFDAVKPQVEQRTQTIEATVSRHLDEELARIRAFYAASAAPAGAALAIAPPDPNAAATRAALSAEEAAQQQAELERQQKEEQEKERKLEMARERYRLTVHTGLLSAITVFRPLHRYTFQVSPARPGAMAGALPLTVDFDPVGGTALLPTCDTCKGAMAQVCYCEQGPHLVCQACAQVCTSCGRGRCTTHALKSCSVDGAGVCDECLFEADECGHAACPQHQQRCVVSGRAVCATCARPCSTCGRVSCPTHLLGCHIDQTPVCVTCVVRCARCNEVTCTKDQVRCRTCGEISCTGCASRCADPNCRRFHCNIHLQACATSGCVGMFCPTCVKTCAQCGRVHCPAHTTTCHECQQPVGAGCAITCVSHGHPLCRKHALPCNVCNRLACPKGLIICASCGRATCLQEIQRCRLDGQPFCPSCSDRCATCNAVHCAAHHLTTCGECGRRHCPSHILACHVDGKPYCVLHQATCAACGRHHCKEHTVACQICGQTVCSACQGKKGVCRLCATLGPVPSNDPRILQAAASMSAAGVRPKSVTGWILAETPERRIIVARLLLSDHLFVLRPSDGAPLAHKAFGMFERGVFKFS